MLRRLASMSPAEVAHRLREAGLKHSARRLEGWERHRGPALEPPDAPALRCLHEASPALRAAIAEAATATLERPFEALGRRWPAPGPGPASPQHSFATDAPPRAPGGGLSSPGAPAAAGPGSPGTGRAPAPPPADARATGASPAQSPPPDARLPGPPGAEDGAFPPGLWSLDPVSGRHWPRHWCFAIDHRHAPGFGDVKYLWEVNRLQMLPALAAHHALTGAPEALAGLEAALRGWHAENPPWRGLAWSSGIELALRVISLAPVAQWAGAALSPAAAACLREMLSAHLFWLQRFPSRFSSANNHLVAECAGLVTLGTLWPALPGAAEAASRAHAGLCTALLAQILPDGAPAEQSPSYGAFTTELGLFVHRLRPLPGPVRARLDAFARFIRAADLPLPALGDDDEGRVLTLGPPEPGPAHARSVAACAALPGAGHDTAAPDAAPDAAARPPGNAAFRALLLGAPGSALPPAAPGLAVFPEGGLSLLRAGRIALSLDHGPLGYLSIAAHGHADALSLTLAVDGAAVLVDPGTWAYHAGGGWRDWLRSTPAHNTLSIAGGNQSRITGPFNWGRHARSRLVSARAEPAELLAETDAWRRRHGCLHRRRIRLLPEGLEIRDSLPGARPGLPVSLTFQLAPGCEVALSPTAARVSRDGTSLLTLTFPPGSLRAPCGAAGPDGGWVSPRFGALLPAPRLVWSGASGADITTRLTLA